MSIKHLIITMMAMVATTAINAQTTTDVATIRKNAQAGNVKAQVQLANMLLAGNGIKKLPTKATSRHSST